MIADPEVGIKENMFVGERDHETLHRNAANGLRIGMAFLESGIQVVARAARPWSDSVPGQSTVGFSPVPVGTGPGHPRAGRGPAPGGMPRIRRPARHGIPSNCARN